MNGCQREKRDSVRWWVPLHVFLTKKVARNLAPEKFV